MIKAPNLTKHRDEGGWRIRSNGIDTNLRIEKGAPAKFGQPQEYDVVNTGCDAWLFSARGVALAMDTVAEIYAEVARGVK